MSRFYNTGCPTPLVLVGDRLYFFGKRKSYGHVLNLSLGTWSTFNFAHKLAGLGSEIVLAEDKIYITVCEDTPENTLVEFDILLPESSTKIVFKPTTEIPGSRYASLAWVEWRREILLFGGLKRGQPNWTRHNEAFALNLDRRTCQKLVSKGDPFPRAGHEAIIVGKHMFVYGGAPMQPSSSFHSPMSNVQIAYISDRGGLLWSTPKIRGLAITQLHYYHYLGGRLLCFAGGKNSGQQHNEVRVACLRTEDWSDDRDIEAKVEKCTGVLPKDPSTFFRVGGSNLYFVGTYVYELQDFTGVNRSPRRSQISHLSPER